MKPILRENCAGCHNPATARGGLDLTSYGSLMRGGSSGDVVVPGDPDASTLFQLISHQREPHMPPNAPRRPDADLETVRQWIAGGLLERKGGTAQAAAKAKVDLRVSGSAMQRPAGPPPMPEGLSLQPVSRPERTGPVVAMAASPWAPLVALAGAGQIAVYRTDSLELVGVLPFSEGDPHALKFSRSGKLLLCGGGVGASRGRVVIWDVVTGKRLSEVGDEFDAVLAADISPDQGAVALGGPARLVRIYAADDAHLIRDIKKHTDWVTAIEYSPDGVLLATGDRGGGLILWEAQGGEEFQVLQGHQGAITDVSWRKDADVLASASEDGTIRLWNPNDGKQIKQWNAHDGGVLSVEYANDGRIVSCGRDRRVRIWDGSGKQESAIEGFGDIVLSVAISDDGKRAIAGDWGGGVAVIDTGTGERLGALRADPPTLAENIAQATAAIASSRAKINSIQEQLAHAQAAAVTHDASLDAIKSRAAEAEKKFKEAEGQAAALAKAAEAAAAELEKTRTAIAAKESETATIAGRRKAEMEKLAAASAALASMEGAIAEQKKKADALVAAQATAKADADANATDPAKAAAAAKAQQEAQAAAAELDRLAQAQAQARTGVEKIAAAIKAINDEAARSNANAEALRKVAEEKKRLADDAAAKVADADKARQAAAAARDETGKTVAAALPRADAARKQAGELQRSLENTRREMTVAEAVLERGRDAQLDELIRATARRIAPNAKEPPPLPELVQAASVAIDKLRPSDLHQETNALVSANGGAGGARVAGRGPLAQPPWFFLGRFHLVLLHLPIGILLAAFLLEMDFLWRRNEWSGRFAGQLLYLGAAMAALTAIFGLLLALEPGYDPADIRAHKWLGIAAAAGAIGAALTRRLTMKWGRVAYWSLFGQMLLCVLLAGHAGGELTHGKGFLTRYLPHWFASSIGARVADPATDGSEFDTSIRPIFEANCQSCHGAQRQSGGLRLDRRETAFAGGKSGLPAIVPGRPLESELIRRVLLPREHDDAMPPSSKPGIRDQDVMRLVRWINAGAPWSARPPATASVTPGHPQ
ncbi:MAG TPA: c-type cytochrome [Verrucomicrobiae bacterium]|nr:c-type cytochrome [Verrucomicrobiae bacterium]